MELGGDLLWMSSDIYLDRSEGSWGNSRGTLFRESPKGGLLGPLNARRVELGDLYTVPTMDLVGALPQGRGLNISNYPVNYSVRFATKTFRGPLPVGWSVEFFQNGSLVGYQPPTGTGVYLFQDVPLRFGINLFQLVFHGPLGEVREEKYRLDISQDQPAPGAFYYGVAGVQPRADEVNALLPYGTADSSLVKPSYMVHADYGLSTAFSVQGGAAGMEQVNGFNSYAMMGVRGVWSFLALQMTAAQDQGVNPTPGTGLEWVLSTGNAYSTLTVRRDQFLNGFQRSIYDSADLGAIGYVVKDATGVDLNWTLKLLQLPLSLSAQVDEENYVGGAEGTRERIILSTHAQGVNISNSITRLTLPQQPNPLQGDLMATMFKTGWSWQGNLYYDQDRVTGWGAQAQFNAPKGYQVHLRCDRSGGFDLCGGLAGTRADQRRGPAIDGPLGLRAQPPEDRLDLCGIPPAPGLPRAGAPHRQVGQRRPIPGHDRVRLGHRLPGHQRQRGPGSGGADHPGREVPGGGNQCREPGPGSRGHLHHQAGALPARGREPG